MIGAEIKASIGQMCLANAKDVQELGLTDAASTAILDTLDDGNVRVSAKKSTRRSTRLPIRGVVTVVSGFGAFRGRLRDSSRRGASFICRTACDVGDKIRLDMPTLDGPVERQATVVRCRHVDGPVYEIGVEFKGIF